MVQNPLFQNGLVDGVFHLAKNQMPELVKDYVNAIETELTNKWCRCGWITHPDDLNVPKDGCRNCGFTKESALHSPAYHGFDHQFLGRRMMRGAENPQCIVHTKEGFILGFFEYLFPVEEKELKDGGS